MISRQVHDEEVNKTLIDFPSNVPQSYIIKTALDGTGTEMRSRNKRRTSSKSDRKHSKSDDQKKNENNKKRSKEEILILVLFIGSSLYNKYVKKNSDLEINISSALRRKFVQMFTGHNNQNKNVEIDLDEVIQLFVDGNKAMYTLLGYSFARFKVKTDFERLCKSESSFSNAKSLSNQAQQQLNMNEYMT